MANVAENNFAFDKQSFFPYRSSDLSIKVANESWEKQGYFKLRRQVFSEEQQLLPKNEQDSADFKSIPIVALSANCGLHDDVVGAVRIFQTTYKEHGDTYNTWYGGRLCVSENYRGFHAIGKSLINEAVSRAKDSGCTKFLANVQIQNERYFKRLHWTTIERMNISGIEHVLMSADLKAFPFMPRHLNTL